MYWVTLRQHRAQVLITFGLLAVFGAVLLVHGLGTVSAAEGRSGGALEEVLAGRHYAIFTLIGWLPLLPLLIGVFWGAPVLAKEYERGTLVLAWTQSVSRRQWVAGKLTLLGLLVTLAGLALGAMINAWIGTFDGTQYAVRFSRVGAFMTTGVAAAGWWLFAFMLGVAGGALFRRMLPAMIAAIAVFLAVLFAMVWVRPEYATPERYVPPVERPLDSPDGDVMIIGTAWLDGTGREISSDVVPTCLDVPTFEDCLASSGYRMVSYVHQAGQYWRFQWTEAGLLLAAALVLGGVGYHRVVRRGAR